MSSGSSFVGAGFSLGSVAQLGATTLRLTYTNDPLQTSSSGPNDALNISNYTLTGPGINQVIQAFVVGADPQSIDLLLLAPLVPGTWTISAANVQTPLGASLTAPTSLSFVAGAIFTAPPLSGGATNDDEEKILRKHLSPALVGPGWDAVIAAFATGDAYRNRTARTAFDQLFKISASGVYLDRRAADDGFSRPAEVGISDDVFRKLAIKTTAYKQIVEVMLESLEAYYGSEATRAFVASTVPEPWALQHGDTLLVQPDLGKVITVTFEQDDFTLAGAAKATEVAAVITRELRKVDSTAYAVAFKDPSLNQSFVKIFSGSLGLRGSMRILGGRAQNEMRFPTAVHTLVSGPQIGTQFSITPGTGINGVAAGRVKFTFIGGTNPALQEVRVGDYVNLYGTIFTEALRGTYTITDTSSTTFEIENALLTWPASVTLIAVSDVRFFRPTRSTILNAASYATATQGDPSTLDVILPATTQAVGRTQNTAAYLHIGNSQSIASASRTTAGVLTVTTATAHGLAANDWVYIDGLFATMGALPGFGWAAADATANSLQFQDSAAIKLSDGTVLQAGGSSAGVRQTGTRLFTPSTNTWATKTAMSRARRGHTLTLLASGKILVVGGNNVSNICELYDPASNTWTDTGATANTHDYHTATVLNDGKVLVIGGGSASEIYDPVTGLWSALTNQPSIVRSYHTASKLVDGRVLIAGGSNAHPTGLNTAEVYNHVNGRWTTTGNMTSARWGHQALVLPVGTSGSVLIVGGSTNGSTFLSSAELFNPATMTFAATSSMTTGRLEAAAAIRADGLVIVTGGQTAAGPTVLSATAELYDPVGALWTTVSGSFTGARSTHDAIVLSDGRVLLAGGEAVSAVAHKYTGAPVNAGQLNGLYRVTNITSPTAFTVNQPDAAYATTCGAVGTVTAYRSPTNSIQGPFIFDQKGGCAVTGVTTTTSDQLTIHNSYNVVTVANANQFPDDEGYLVFGFGTANSLTPVRYLGRISSTLLLLDPSYVFPQTIPVGTSVTLLENRGIFEPSSPETLGTFYLTAAAAGRVAASKTIDDLVAAGVNLRKTVIYPGDVGLGNAGYPASGNVKISDKVLVWGGDDVDEELEEARDS